MGSGIGLTARREDKSMQNSVSTLFRLATAALLLLLPVTSQAQSSDPIIGNWNLTGSQNRTTIVIAVMNFNLGGTTVEFDTSGTNSAASPGESIDLGVWKNTGSQTYAFKEQNFIYDSSGSLSELAVGACTLTLSTSKNAFLGTCNLNFYNCSLTQCPGSLVTGPIFYHIAAKRF
jgi:hypothetical protein